jgi:uncharacterized protein YcsI (UPF0317 family)
MSFVQTNVVFLPKQHTKDFLLFCQRNPKPCPLLEVSEDSEAKILAPGSDLYRDLPKYTLVEKGIISTSLPSIEAFRDQGLDVFLLGCSFSFEQALLEAGIPIRHIEQGKNVSMFVTNIPCRPAGVFKGQLVVSMRPIPRDLVEKAARISARFPAVHGAPVHIGKPEVIGIRDLGVVDFGEPVEIFHGDVPVFWACGVTPLQAIVQSGIEFAITHSPGHMFITDKRNKDLDVGDVKFSIVE